MAETDYIYNGQSAPLTPDRHGGAAITHLGKGDPASQSRIPTNFPNTQSGNYKNTPGKHIIYSQNLLVVCAKLICVNI